MSSEGAEFKIRRATVAEVPQIAEIHVRAWKTAYRGIMDDAFLDALAPAQRIPRWVSFVNDATHRMTVLVAVETATSRVLGFCSVCPRRDDRATVTEGELYTLYVDPRCQRGGIGRSLIAAGEADLHARGFTTAILWMLAGNAAARAFYERCGWRADGGTRTERYGDRPVPEIRLAKSLGDISEGEKA